MYDLRLASTIETALAENPEAAAKAKAVLAHVRHVSDIEPLVLAENLLTSALVLSKKDVLDAARKLLMCVYTDDLEIGDRAASMKIAQWEHESRLVIKTVLPDPACNH